MITGEDIYWTVICLIMFYSGMVVFYFISRIKMKEKDKKIEEMSNESEWKKILENSTWRCHVCEEVRPNHAISVLTKDVGHKYNLPEGTMTMNIRYCNDKPTCIEGAKKVDWIGRKENNHGN